MSDPAAVMAAHAEHIQINGRCEHGWAKFRAFTAATDQHCEPYRLAEALAAEREGHALTAAALVGAHEALAAAQAKVARVEAICDEAEAERRDSFSRMFSGQPFPATLDTIRIRSVLADQPERGRL